MSRDQSKMTPQDAAVSNALLLPDAAKQRLDLFYQTYSKQIIGITAGKDAQRIMRVTYSILYRTPKLIACTPFSLLNGIVLAHQMGLVLGTQEAALVPFGQEATLIIQYQGKVKLALASRLITAIQADCVITGETFVCETTERGLRFLHKPNWAGRPEASEDNVVGAYCQLRTAAGAVQTKFCPLSEILSARNRSRGYKYQVSKNGTDNPWFSDFGAMALKTAVHRAMKLAPQDARLGLSQALDDQDQGGPAVIAEGLNPNEFAARDLNEPLVETGTAAARGVANGKMYPDVREVDVLPDPVPLSVGALLKFKGIVYEVADTPDEGYKWQEAK